MLSENIEKYCVVLGKNNNLSIYSRVNYYCIQFCSFYNIINAVVVKYPNDPGGRQVSLCTKTYMNNVI